MLFPLHRFNKIALINLLIVAAIGVILRFKIAFSLPFLDQRHLLDGHSHFAFTGWITHAIMVMLVSYIAAKKDEPIARKYRWLINANLFTAYGMLISFILQGYGLYSILFTILSIVVSYIFAFNFWKDLNRQSPSAVSVWWMKAALLFNVLSSAGALSLAYMMATKSINQSMYLASVYFFLHFQYNGWFLFACIGLFTNKVLYKASTSALKKIFWLFAFACVPAYLLSTLWLPIPAWLYVVIVIAAFSQLVGWVMMVKQIMLQLKFIQLILNTTTQWILLLSAIALSIKLLLQLGSTIPSLSKIAFGFRPIVIGYLHLILLGVITLFLLGYMFADKHIRQTTITITGIKVFALGIVLNELLLMTQGIASLSYTPIAYINEMLFAAACILFTGIGLLNINKTKSTK